MHGSSRAIGVAAAIGLALAPAVPAFAGSLNKCDQARLAARGAVLRVYQALRSDLSAEIAETKAGGADPTNAPYRDINGEPRAANLIALEQELEARQAADLGEADRKVASECRDQSESVEDLAKLAERIATLGIAAVLPKHMVNADFSAR